jgi:hypothetical protein
MGTSVLVILRRHASRWRVAGRPTQVPAAAGRSGSCQPRSERDNHSVVSESGKQSMEGEWWGCPPLPLDVWQRIIGKLNFADYARTAATCSMLRSQAPGDPIRLEGTRAVTDPLLS